MKSIKIVFMGSPDFAVPALRMLVDNFTVLGVVTQPDRPAGRGRKLKAPPVKAQAETLGLPILQTQRLHKDPNVMAQIHNWQPDLIAVAAFGQILKPEVLDLPPYGCLNIHGSLLPRWRGAAPLNAAILHGDQETGITIMKMDPGLDTGPMLAQRAIPINPKDTAGSLFEILSVLGAQLLVETIPAYVRGELQPETQDDDRATYAPILKRSDGALNFNQTSGYLARQIRAYHPWPGNYFSKDGANFKVHAAHVSETTSPGAGVFIVHDGFPAVGTSSGVLVFDQIQPAGKKTMTGDVFLRGAKNW